MVMIQIDLPERLNKKIGIIKIKREEKNKAETIINILESVIHKF